MTSFKSSSVAARTRWGDRTIRYTWTQTREVAQWLITDFESDYFVTGSRIFEE